MQPSDVEALCVTTRTGDTPRIRVSKKDGEVIVSAETVGALTFESMLTDPLIRAVMDSDGVTVDELVAVLEAAQRAVAAREQNQPRILSV